MIGWRYHLVAVVAVLAALLTGVVVGAGPLAAGANTRLQSQKGHLRSEGSDLRRQVDTMRRQASAEAALTKAASEAVLANQLRGRSVAVFALPGVPASTVSAESKSLVAAGATVVQTLEVTRTYFDPKNAKSPLEDLALRLVPPEVEFPDGVDPIDRVSTVLARATVTTKQDDADTVDQPAAEVLAGLADLGAVRTTSGDPGRRAELALVLAPPSTVLPGGGARVATDAATGLVSALDKGSRGAVVAGPAAAATAGGVVAAVRDASLEGVSTVDLADRSGGPLAVVLAVRQQLRGSSGNYGDGAGAQALFPEFLPPPQ